MRCLGEGVGTEAELVATGIGAHFAPAFAPDGTVHILVQKGPRTLILGEFELADGDTTIAQPAFAIDRVGGYHAVWVRQGTPFTLEYRHSGDAGATWQEAESLTDETTRPGVALNLVADER